MVSSFSNHINQSHLHQKTRLVQNIYQNYDYKILNYQFLNQYV